MDLSLGQIVSQILGFLIMLWILKRFAWKPILDVLELRKERIASEFAEIKKQEETLKSLQDELREKIKAVNASAAERLNEELAKAKKLSEHIQEQAEQSAQEFLKSAKDEMRLEVIKARNSLKNEMVDLIVGSTEKILKEKMDDEKVNRRFVEERLQEIK